MERKDINSDIIKKIRYIRDQLDEIISENSPKNFDKIEKNILRNGDNDDSRYNNIAVSLDNIDEMFDDFDDNPEVYETRTLSDDFIDVIKNRYRNSFKKLRVILLIPQNDDIEDLEEVIIARVKEQLKLKLKDEGFKVLRKIFLSLGYFSIGFFTFLNFSFLKNLVNTFLNNNSHIGNEIVLIVGWVGIWECITTFVDCFNDELKDYFFLSKIQKASYKIKGY